MTAEEQAKAIATALEERKGTDVKIYDVRGKSTLADFFVVATGAAAPHLKALIAESQAAMKAARKLRGENPTPKAMPTIKYELNEELADTMTALRVVMETGIIDMELVREVRRRKIKRWADRLTISTPKVP